MENMTETTEQKITKKALSVKQLEANLVKLQKDKQRAEEKLLKQIEQTKQKEQSAKSRKVRNKKIYDWGGLLPSILGVKYFDDISDNADFKNVLRGLLVKLHKEANTTGFGIDANGKTTWLEYYKNEGHKTFNNSAKPKE